MRKNFEPSIYLPLAKIKGVQYPTIRNGFQPAEELEPYNRNKAYCLPLTIPKKVTAISRLRNRTTAKNHFTNFEAVADAFGIRTDLSKIGCWPLWFVFDAPTEDKPNITTSAKATIHSAYYHPFLSTIDVNGTGKLISMLEPMTVAEKIEQASLEIPDVPYISGAVASATIQIAGYSAHYNGHLNVQLPT